LYICSLDRNEAWPWEFHLNTQICNWTRLSGHDTRIKSSGRTTSTSTKAILLKIVQTTTIIQNGRKNF
ncbi:hypothetical protein L9F63_013506, partial [Diploptera punctata]